MSPADREAAARLFISGSRVGTQQAADKAQEGDGGQGPSSQSKPCTAAPVKTSQEKLSQPVEGLQAAKPLGKSEHGRFQRGPRST